MLILIIFYHLQSFLFVVVNIIIKSSIMLFPIIPKSTKKILSMFNMDINNINFNKFDLLISKNIIIDSPSPIFPRIL